MSEGVAPRVLSSPGSDLKGQTDRKMTTPSSCHRKVKFQPQHLRPSPGTISHVCKIFCPKYAQTGVLKTYGKNLYQENTISKLKVGTLLKQKHKINVINVYEHQFLVFSTKSLIFCEEELTIFGSQSSINLRP